MSRMDLPEVIEALSQFDSATVSNAIEAFNTRDRTEGYASMELRCQFPDLAPMVGYAVTCTADSTTPGPLRRSKLPDFLDLVAAAPQPAVAVIQNVGPDPLRSCFVGDVISAACRKLGVIGMVTDGGVRDLKGILLNASGLQVFAPGVVVSHGSATIVDVNVPVSICGLDIRPGDLLHGDENGLLKVPHDIAGAVVEQARVVRQKEAEVFELLRSASVTLDEIKSTVGGADIARHTES